MNVHYKTIVKLSAGFLVLIITYGVIHFYTHPYVEKPLVIYHETRFEGIGMSLLLVESTQPQKVTLPKTFNVGQVRMEMGKRTVQVIKKHLFYYTLRPGDTVEYSFNSSDPVWFTVALCDEPTWDLKTKVMVFDEPNIITYQANYTTNHETMICFRFKTEPPMTSKIAFKGIIRKKVFN